MTVRAAEEYARRTTRRRYACMPDRRGARRRARRVIETRTLEEEEFTRAIEMKARLQRSTKGKGSLTLYFTNEQQLQVLYQRIVGAERDGLATDAADPGAWMR